MPKDEIYLGPPKSEPLVVRAISNVDPIEYVVAGVYPELTHEPKLFEIAVSLAVKGMNAPAEEA